MFAAERRQRILELVRSSGAVSLRDLARQFETSEATVRRDLRFLDAEGLLDRHYGGAVAAASGMSHEPTYSEKANVAAEEKAAIAELAAGIVTDGDAIIVGAGTTTEAFARQLVRFNELTVITNSLLVAMALSNERGIEVVLTGGTLRGSIHALVGSRAEGSLRQMYTTRAFVSGNGLTASRGLSTPNISVASMDRALAATAQEVVVLADYTKIGVDTMVQTVPPDAIAQLVTDDRADATHLAELRGQGVTVHLASTRHSR